MLVAGGSTDVTTYFALRLTANGTAATGLTITDFDLQYVRSGVAPSAKVDATALAATDSVHADNKAIEIDATDQPGLYRVDWPDAAFAAGVREAILTVKVATAFTEHLRVEIDGEVTAEALGTQAKTDVNAEADTAISDAALATAAALEGVKDTVDAIPTTAMRGTDNAALATVATEARLAELDPANMPADIDAIPTTAMRGTDSASTHTAADIWTSGTRTLTSFGTLIADIWHHLLTAITTAGSIGKLIKDSVTEARMSELDAGTGGKMANQVDLIKTEADKIALADAGAGVAGSVIEEVENRSTHDAAAVWTSGTRTLTAFSTALGLSVWDVLLTAIGTASSIGKLIKDSVTEARMSELDAGTSGKMANQIDLIEAKTTNLPSGIKKNTALNNFPFEMIDSTDNVSPKTGLTVTGQRRIDGGAFVALANAPTEISNGAYSVNLAASDLNGDTIMLRFTSAGANDALITIVTEP